MTTITFAFRQPGGANINGGKVAFTLSGYDVDEGIVLSAAVEALIGAGGTGSVDLWPNYSGLKGTSYKVAVTPAGGTPVDLGSIVVPVSATPIPLHQLIQPGNVGTLKTRVLTQAEYDALTSTDPQTLYLIRAEA